jgi:hypothetical protein
MQTWVKATLGGAALVLAAMLAIGGTGAYFVLNHLERQTVPERASRQRLEAIRARSPSRPPLVELVDPRRGDVRINRPDRDSAVRPATVHVINWKAETGELVETELPLWLMRFSSINLLSQAGLAPERFRLTVDDIQRYGPGIIVDHNLPDASHLLVWVE